MNSSSASSQALPHEVRFTLQLLDQIKELAASIAVPFGQQFASNDGTHRLGGFVCIMDKFGQQLLMECIGDPDDHKKNNFRANASNKCVCLFNRNTEPYAVSSWVLRDLQASPPKYGGGIRLSNGGFLSFSGYPEEVDEAFCISLAKKFGLLASALEQEIISISGNTLVGETDAWLRSRG